MVLRCASALFPSARADEGDTSQTGTVCEIRCSAPPAHKGNRRRRNLMRVQSKATSTMPCSCREGMGGVRSRLPWGKVCGRVVWPARWRAEICAPNQDPHPMRGVHKPRGQSWSKQVTPLHKTRGLRLALFSALGAATTRSSSRREKIPFLMDEHRMTRRFFERIAALCARLPVVEVAKMAKL